MQILICVTKDEFLERKRIRFKFDVFALSLMLLYEKFDVFEMSLAGNARANSPKQRCSALQLQTNSKLKN